MAHVFCDMIMKFRTNYADMMRMIKMALLGVVFARFKHYTFYTQKNKNKTKNKPRSLIIQFLPYWLWAFLKWYEPESIPDKYGDLFFLIGLAICNGFMDNYLGTTGKSRRHVSLFWARQCYFSAMSHVWC